MRRCRRQPKRPPRPPSPRTVTDAADAHDASAITIVDAGNDFTATDVEGALAELQADHETDEAALAAHLADRGDAHEATAMSIVDAANDFTATEVEGRWRSCSPTMRRTRRRSLTISRTGRPRMQRPAVSVSSATLSGTGTDVQAVLEESDNLLDDHSGPPGERRRGRDQHRGLDGTPTELTNHLNDAADAHDASAISVLDTGANYTATDVEGVLAEIAPQLGGSGPAQTLSSGEVNQNSHGLAVGDVIRKDGDDYVQAQADSAVNAEVVGIVTAVADIDNFTYVYGGRVEPLSGLTSGTVYFLSAATPGALTATEPTGIGEVSKPILIATDTDDVGLFFNFRGYVVSEGDVFSGARVAAQHRPDDRRWTRSRRSRSTPNCTTRMATTPAASRRRLTAPADGKYLIGWNLRWSAAQDGGFRYSHIALNGNTAAAGTPRAQTTPAAPYPRSCRSAQSRSSFPPGTTSS